MEHFRLKRTKMIDEAAFNHKPQPLYKSFLIFVLVYAIANLLRGFISTIPTIFWLFSNSSFLEFLKEYTAQAMSGTVNEEDLVAFMESLISSTPWWLSLVALIATVAFAAASIFYCKKIEKRSISSMGITKKGFFKEYGIGALIGIVMSALACGIAILCGSVSIRLNPNSFSFAILLLLVGFIIQGASKAVFFGGYYMVSVARDYKVAVAVGFSSVVFALVESGTTVLSVINVFLLGVFLGIYVFKRGDIIGACAIHAMWSFVQTSIFGLGSGNTIPSVFVATLKDGKELANGGSFGILGGVASTVVLLIAIGVLALIKEKKGIVSITEEIRLD